MEAIKQMGETKSGEIPAQMKKVIEDNNLLTEILVRIRPAIVISFKSVSKRWLNLISSHPFRLYHSRRSPAYFPATSLILQVSSPSPQPTKLKRLDFRRSPKIKSLVYFTSSRSHGDTSSQSRQANHLMGSSVPHGDTFRSLQSRNSKLLFPLKNNHLVHQELDLSISSIFDNWPLSHRPNPGTASFEILHASNGLLLLSVKASSGTRDYLCNPFTREYIQLPPIPYGQSQQATAFLYGGRRPELGFVKKCMRLVFDPVKSAHYKVVRISYKTLPDGSSYVCVQVYSSTNRSWHIRKEIFSSTEFRGISDSVVFKDVLCWTTSPSGKRLHIFDVSSLSIRSLPLPEMHMGSLSRCLLFESRSILYLVETLGTGISLFLHENYLNSHFSKLGGQHTSKFSYKIWEMNDIENSSWETKFEFQLEDLMEIVHIRCSHKEQGLQIFLVHNSLMYCLNSENYIVDKKLERVGELSSRMSRPWDIITYTKTLFPLV